MGSTATNCFDNNRRSILSSLYASGEDFIFVPQPRGRSLARRAAFNNLIAHHHLTFNPFFSSRLVTPLSPLLLSKKQCFKHINCMSYQHHRCVQHSTEDDFFVLRYTTWSCNENPDKGVKRETETRLFIKKQKILCLKVRVRIEPSRCICVRFEN